MTRWFLPKDAVLAIAAAIGSLCLARGRLPRWFTAFLVAVVMLLLVAVLASANPAAQLWGAWPRYEGLISLPVYAAAMWLGARLLGPAAGINGQRTLHRATIIVATLLGGISLLESWGLRPIASDLARPGSLTGNATDQGIVGAFCVAILLLPLIRAFGIGAAPAAVRTRVSLCIGVVGGFSAVVVSASRAAVLAVVIVMVVLAVFELVRLQSVGTRRQRLATGVGALGGLLLLAGAVFLVPFTRDRLIGASPLSTSSLTDRLSIWAESLQLVASRPLTGVGPGGFVDAIVAEHDRDWYANVGSETTLDSPHNWLLQVALDGGLPLLALVLALAVSVGVTGVSRWKTERRFASGSRADLIAGACAALAGYSIALLTHFTVPSTAILAGVLCGAIVAVPPTGGMRAHRLVAGRRSGLRMLRTAFLGVWAVSLLCVAAAEVPMQSALNSLQRGQVVAANTSFESAQALRPWDADTASIAAQAFAAAADSSVPGAVPFALDWGRAAHAALPDSVAVSLALAVSKQAAGNLPEAEAVLRPLAERVPLDSTIARRLGTVLLLQGDQAGAELEFRRAESLSAPQQ